MRASVRHRRRRASRTAAKNRDFLGHHTKAQPPPAAGARRQTSTPVAPIVMSRASTSHEATFTLENEDHTLGNALRYVLNANPAVTLCGYSVPHPMERKVNVRVQTNPASGVTAQGVMRDALLDVISVCDHVHETFEKAEAAFAKGKK